MKYWPEKQEYRAYLESLRGVIPNGLFDIVDEFSLKEAQFQGLKLGVSAARLVLHLIGYDQTGGAKAGRRYLRLSYEGVYSFQMAPSREEEIIVALPEGAGIVHDELELLFNGVIEHRILFSSGAEFIIKFKDFSYETMSEAD